MEAKLFAREELEHRLTVLADNPPIGTQWWELPPERIAAAVVDHQDGTMSLYLLRTEEDFSNRPFGSRLVTLHKDRADFQPQRNPKTDENLVKVEINFKAKSRTRAKAPRSSNWGRLSLLYQD